jgi:hypothetical protein
MSRVLLRISSTIPEEVLLSPRSLSETPTDSSKELGTSSLLKECSLASLSMLVRRLPSPLVMFSQSDSCLRVPSSPIARPSSETEDLLPELQELPPLSSVILMTVEKLVLSCHLETESKSRETAEL